MQDNGSFDLNIMWLLPLETRLFNLVHTGYGGCSYANALGLVREQTISRVKVWPQIASNCF